MPDTKTDTKFKLSKMKQKTFNNCSRSNISVTPANWNTQKASVKKPWRIHYRFYDPAFKDDPEKWGFPVRIKGMNTYKTLQERQEVTADLLRQERQLIDVLGFNPVTGQYMAPEHLRKNDEKLTPKTPFIRALELGLRKVEAEKKTLDDIAIVLKFFSKSAVQLGFADLPINEIRRGDIMAVLDNCQHQKKMVKGHEVPIVWNDNQYNHFRKYISIIYTTLEVLEIVEYNPIRKIPVKQIISEETTRAILTEDQQRDVAALLIRYPLFRRFVNCFFSSGARIAEILRVRGAHVDLPNQRFRVLVKKRKKKVWVWKTITDSALPFWAEIMDTCGLEQYVFSRFLKPGDKAINPRLITRRWSRLVKKRLHVEADFYSLKHLYTTSIMEELEAAQRAREAALAVASSINSHTTHKVTDQVYDVRKADRQHETAKKLGRNFD